MKKIKHESFIAVNVAPQGIQKIGLYNSKGVRIGGIDAGNLIMPIVGEKLYSCGVISDVHLQYPTAKVDFEKALKYLTKQEKVNFICICGDLTKDGTDEELQEYREYVDTYSPATHVYAITGNHECRTPNVASRIHKYTKYPLYYSFTKGDDVYIMLGVVNEKSGSLFADGELQWFYERLEANRNKRCFVFQHVRPQDGCGNALGIYLNDLWDENGEGKVFESLLQHYQNVILFHGHSHVKFDMQEFDDTANYGNEYGYHSVHIPSIAVPAFNSGSLVEPSYEYNYAGSEGYVMDVYKNHVILRGRNFISEKFLPIATYCLDTTLKTIEPNSFTDSTGTIIT